MHADQLEAAYKPGKTKAVMMAHALGNPFDIATTLAFCRKYDLWLIGTIVMHWAYLLNAERACRKTRFNQNSPGLNEGADRIVRWTGCWGDISTQSFYPPHHITMGEGGAINIISSAKLKVIAESLRLGSRLLETQRVDNSCSKRFEWQLGELPNGYDHKYTYSHLGYNLKPLDLQASIGRIQLKRLPEFIAARKENWLALRRG